MSGRSYPIWNQVQACIYKSSKDWGARERSKVTVNVGSSAKNSHSFLTHEVTHKLLEGGDREFRFYLDGVCLKRAVVTADKEYKPMHPEENMRLRGVRMHPEVNNG